MINFPGIKFSGKKSRLQCLTAVQVGIFWYLNLNSNPSIPLDSLCSKPKIYFVLLSKFYILFETNVCFTQIVASVNRLLVPGSLLVCYLNGAYLCLLLYWTHSRTAMHSIGSSISLLFVYFDTVNQAAIIFWNKTKNLSVLSKNVITSNNSRKSFKSTLIKCLVTVRNISIMQIQY